MSINIQSVLPTSRDRSIVMLNIRFNDNGRASSRCSDARCLFPIANPHSLSAAASCVSVLLIFLQEYMSRQLLLGTPFFVIVPRLTHTCRMHHRGVSRNWVAACMSQRVCCMLCNVTQHNLPVRHTRTIISGLDESLHCSQIHRRRRIGYISSKPEISGPSVKSAHALQHILRHVCSTVTRTRRLVAQVRGSILCPTGDVEGPAASCYPCLCPGIRTRQYIQLAGLSLSKYFAPSRL